MTKKKLKVQYTCNWFLMYNDQFDEWFDKNKFEKIFYFYLVQYCPDHFDKWFDAKTFDYYFCDFLAEHCSEHFDKWFDKDTFNWQYAKMLHTFCKDKEHIWQVAYKQYVQRVA